MSSREEFNGWCLSGGLFFRKLHPSDLCDLVYYWLTKELDGKAKYRLDFELNIPPANVAPAEDDPMWSEDAEMAFFRK